MKLLAVFLLLIFGADVGPVPMALRAENQTDVKIRLMSEALIARDAGDFPKARSKLDALTQIAPNDPGIRRLLGEIAKKEEELRAAQEHPPTPPPAPIVLPEPALVAETSVGPTPVNVNAAKTTVTSPRSEKAVAPPPFSTPVPVPNTNLATGANRTGPSEQLAGISVIEERPVTPTPPPDHFAEAMAKVEKEGVAFAQGGENQGEKLMTYVQAQRTLARAYANDGNYAEATNTLEEALRSLQSSVDELKTERRIYIKKEVETEEAKKGVRLKRHR